MLEPARRLHRSRRHCAAAGDGRLQARGQHHPATLHWRLPEATSMRTDRRSSPGLEVAVTTDGHLLDAATRAHTPTTHMTLTLS